MAYSVISASLMIIWILLPSLIESLSEDREFQGDKGNRIVNNEERPNFLVEGQTIRAVLGETVILPCEVENLGRYNVFWRWGDIFLTAGPSFIVSTNRTLRLIDGYNLEIRNLTTQDAGNYICQISDLKDVELVHVLEILVPPSIKSPFANRPLIFRKGENVSLECEASGNPPPVIYWTRKDNIFSKEKKTAVGPFISLYSIDRHYSGIYMCTACNGVKPPATEHFKVEVYYIPEIEVLANTVYTGEGYEAQLECVVYAQPPAKVEWYHEGVLLDITERRIMDFKGNKHKLLIINIRVSDFGNYSCVARNSLGKDTKDLVISGVPSPATFESPSESLDKHCFNLTWLIRSYSPLEEIRLLYRRLTINDTHKGPGKWEHVKLKYDKPEKVVYVMSHNIKYLSPGCIYEAVVQSRNRFGWSESSEWYQFYTKKEDLEEIAPLISSSKSIANISSYLNQLLKVILLLNAATLVVTLSMSYNAKKTFFNKKRG